MFLVRFLGRNFGPGISLGLLGTNFEPLEVPLVGPIFFQGSSSKSIGDLSKTQGPEKIPWEPLGNPRGLKRYIGRSLGLIIPLELRTTYHNGHIEAADEALELTNR